MEEQNPLQSGPDKLGSALSKVGTDLYEIAQSASLSINNRDKLFKASSLIQEVFIEIVNGENDRQKELQDVQSEGAVLLGEKRYVFEYRRDPNDEPRVWVEQEGKRHRLPQRDPQRGFNWGYFGSGPSTLTWALINDCFGSENLPAAVQSDLYTKVYTLVARAPGGKDDVLHEHELRDCLDQNSAEG